MHPLVSPDDLVSILTAELELRVCDVRWYLADPGQGRREYDRGHIPGAIFFDLETTLSASGRGPGRHPLPRVAEFAADLGANGIGPGHRVVAYDDSGGAIAARLWWMLRSIGHLRVQVLDGGYSAYLAAGGLVGTGVPAHPPVTYPTDGDWVGRAGAEQIRAGRHTLIDARAPERYRGETEPVDPRPGHIPGAVNLPHTGNLDERGRYRSPEDLALRYRDAGVDRALNPIVYCGSGVTACSDLLAMNVAGIDGGLLYEGSWSDWCSDPAAPAALGPEPGSR